jgi:hypothetical protein
MTAFFSGIQQSITTFLTTSTMQAMKKHNVDLLTDEDSKFLIHGNNENISSLQYVTVGVGVRDFANNTTISLATAVAS